MLCFPSMLCTAAEAAGIKFPEDADGPYEPSEFVHWHVLCTTQLGRPSDPGEHFDNAIALAKIPEEALKTMTVQELVRRGVGCGN